MKLLINGKSEEICDGLSLKAFLESRNINPNVVACELNLKIQKRASLDETLLREGDVLEIIQMIGGG